MEKSKFFNCIILGANSRNSEVILAHTLDINEVAYNDGDIVKYDPDYEIMESAPDRFYEGDFDDGEYYYENPDGDFEVVDDCDEVTRYTKCEWGDCEHYLELEDNHGINTDYIDITDAEVVEGTCYKADNYIPQDYPNQEYTDFFKFVADDGRVFYIERTSPFFEDQSGDCFELIDEEKFNEYE